MHLHAQSISEYGLTWLEICIIACTSYRAFQLFFPTFFFKLFLKTVKFVHTKVEILVLKDVIRKPGVTIE